MGNDFFDYVRGRLNGVPRDEDDSGQRVYKGELPGSISAVLYDDIHSAAIRISVSGGRLIYEATRGNFDFELVGRDVTKADERIVKNAFAQDLYRREQPLIDLMEH
jgi:hypothetical protein